MQEIIIVIIDLFVSEVKKKGQRRSGDYEKGPWCPVMDGVASTATSVIILTR
jgi:hypothetical protein